MATSDFLDRLGWIADEGARQTGFQVMRGARARNSRDYLKELENQRKRMIQFAVTIPPQDYQKERIQGPSGPFNLAGNGGRPDLYYPVRGARVSSGFGGRTHPISGKHSSHSGIDYAIAAGSPIYAPADAIVRSTDWNKIYGNRTIIDYGGGYSSMFGHQSGYTVKPGQRIRRGQIIGYVGSSGYSTGPHLHFETWINNTPVNPLSWFA